MLPRAADSVACSHDFLAQSRALFIVPFSNSDTARGACALLHIAEKYPHDPDQFVLRRGSGVSDTVQVSRRDVVAALSCRHSHDLRYEPPSPFLHRVDAALHP